MRTHLILFLIPYYLLSQNYSPPTYVIVHGAWGGGWAFKEVDHLMTERKAKVYRPTLSGLGEKAHLLSENINLKTHINDIINVILYEELDEIILVGHSYGGMVITGVSDSIPKKIKKMIYLDAFVPMDNESVFSISLISPPSDKDKAKGALIPSWVDKNSMPPKDVPHPLKTFSNEISLNNKDREKIPTTYILTVKKGASPDQDDFAFHSKRASDKGWEVKYFESDHNPQWSEPKKLTELLILIGQD
tara:strand:+ start:4489 stop:5229 length:741 start_codon:yes stop_codon:yes gene_type:complete